MVSGDASKDVEIRQLMRELAQVMWAVDYPHNEGIFGFIYDVVRSILDTVSADKARMILGGTCKTVFKLGS